MKNSPYSEMVKKYREQAVGAEMAALSDRDLERVAGGVGGADEATCPVCGKAMRVDKSFGDPVWFCDKCDVTQIASDAEFIEIVKYMEKLGYPVDYPVWWNQIK